MRILILIWIFVFVYIQGFSQEKKELYLKSLAHIYYNEFDSAQFCLDKAIDGENTPYYYFTTRGKCYFKQNLFEKALQDFQTAENLKSGCATYNIAQCYSMLGNCSESIKWLDIYLHQSNKNTEASIKLDPAFKPIQETSEWKKIWLGDWYSPTEVSLFDASYFISKNQFYEAIEQLNQLIAKRPKTHQAYYLRAKAAISTGNIKPATLDLNEAIAIDKKNPLYLTERAKIFLAEGKYQKANDDLNMAVSIAPDSIPYLFLRAKSFSGMKKYADAASDLKIYMKYYGKSAEEYYLLGNLYFDNEMYLDALKVYNIVLEKDKTHPEYFASRGKAYLNANSFKLAENDFTMSLDLDPMQADIWFYKGLSRFNQENATGACSDWEKAWNLKKPEAADYLKKYCWK